MFILSFISSNLEYRSVNHNSIYENSELKVFKHIKCLGKISINWQNDLFGTNVYNSLDSNCWLCYSGLTLRQQFSPFLSLVILLLILPSNFMVSGFKSST